VIANAGEVMADQCYSVYLQHQATLVQPLFGPEPVWRLPFDQWLNDVAWIRAPGTTTTASNTIWKITLHHKPALGEVVLYLHSAVLSQSAAHKPNCLREGGGGGGGKDSFRLLGGELLFHVPNVSARQLKRRKVIWRFKVHDGVHNVNDHHRVV
jgi:hypothetical protein